MATIDLRYPHGTTLEDARVRTKRLVEAFVAERPQLVSTLTFAPGDTSATAKGPAFKGEFSVDATHVIAAIDLKLLAKPFKAKVEASLMRRLDEEFGG